MRQRRGKPVESCDDERRRTRRATKGELADALTRARDATLAILAPVPDEELVRQVSPLMSPLVWDLAHIGYFEELWLLRRLGARTPFETRFDDLYDSFRHERRERGALPVLQPDEARAFVADVRRRVLSLLEEIELDEDDPLLRDGFVYAIVLQHELQHQETMLQTVHLCGREYPVPEHGARAASPEVDEIVLPSGSFVLGSEHPWAYDNERPAHVVDVPAFAIERYPFTNARHLEFVEDGGYRDRRLWSDDGWAWLRREQARAPLFWAQEAREWKRLRFGRREPLPPAEPVQHVSYWEAEAVAAWADKRLPTEVEWEKAAQGAPLAHGANVGRGSFGPLPVTERASSRAGVACVLGDVWEWTSSRFTGYPGFTAFPYREYSEVFFGDEYRVLRGGSWATDSLVARVSFRNWDYPQRRQIFSGLRLARDV
jgi:iron(II)-dependent oxidoreductase